MRFYAIFISLPLHLSLKYLQKIKFLLWKIVFYEISIYFSRMFRNFKHLSLFPKVWRELTRKNVRQWKEKFFFQNLFIKYFFLNYRITQKKWFKNFDIENKYIFTVWIIHFFTFEFFKFQHFFFNKNMRVWKR